MSFSMKPIILALALTTALCMTSCSNSDRGESSKSELEEIKQELAELKQEMAKQENVESITYKALPDADSLAFEKAKSDGRVRAFGNYVKKYPEGRHLEAADQGAWASAKRQNSVAAYEAYRRYFPEGLNLEKSYFAVVSSQENASERALKELGYNIESFPSSVTAAIDSKGNFELPKLTVEKVEVLKQPSIESPPDYLEESSAKKARFTRVNCEENHGVEMSINGNETCLIPIKKPSGSYSSAYGGGEIGILETDCIGEISDDFCRMPLVD